MRILVAALLILAGLFTGLFSVHVARRKAWDRPRWTLHPAYGMAWPALRWVLLGAGIALLAVESRAALGVAVVLLSALGGWLAWVRSSRHALGRLRQEIAVLESRFPRTPRVDLATRVLAGWHPEWPPEVIRQLAEENPELEDVARLLVRMERGWPF